MWRQQLLQHTRFSLGGITGHNSLFSAPCLLIYRFNRGDNYPDTGGGADYVLALKGNQGTLHDDVTLYLDNAINKDSLDHTLDFHETIDAGHGRIEIRRYRICDSIDWLDQRKNWSGLKGIGCLMLRLEKTKVA